MDAPNPSATPTFASRTPLHVGAIGLVARDINRLTDYYRNLLGLTVLERTPKLAAEANDPALQAEVEEFLSRVYEFSELLVDRLKVTDDWTRSVPSPPVSSTTSPPLSTM